MRPQQHIFAFGMTDTGKKRERNEDNFLVSPPLNLFVVADGMGGHAGGATASRIAIEIIDDFIRDRLKLLANVEEAANILARALKEASRKIHETSLLVANLHGMGTTVTALMIFDGTAIVAHVGDSRAYLLREGHLKQITEDHSLVHEQMKAGILSEQEARKSRFKNIITRSIGFEDNVEVDITKIDCDSSDTFILFTDGLNTHLSDSDIHQAIRDNYLYKIPLLLIEEANRKGGEDNITVIAVHVLKGTDKKINAKKIRLAA